MENNYITYIIGGAIGVVVLLILARVAKKKNEKD